MKPGERQQTKGERFEQVEREVKNLNMAMRMSQMLVGQVAQQFGPMKQDLNKAVSMLNDLQYRLLALQELQGVDVTALRARADALRLVDYNDASDKEDKDRNYTVADTVEPDSVVIITSVTPDEKDDKGIFRSKFKLNESGSKDLENYLLGKKVGDKVSVVLNDVRHEIEVVGVRKEPSATSTEEASSEQVH